MELRRAHRCEADAIRALLRENALPTDDLDAARIGFVVAVDDGSLLGVGGVEAFGDAGLLRSLAVRSDQRGNGLGARLVGALEAHAREEGLAQLALLTTTAASFFAARGYREIARAAMPDALQASAEFRSLCPASATCMLKSLVLSQSIDPDDRGLPDSVRSARESH